MSQTIQVATLGGGCFWCLEAIYDAVQGVTEIVSGYAGGHADNPSYRKIGSTGHAEVVQLRFDTSIISFHEIVEVFFLIHDPTTLNRQGNDVGSQYRSAVFYHSKEQRDIAEEIIKNLGEKGVFNNPIVTEVTKYEKFFPAEEYHQKYYQKNASQPYCQVVIEPKVAKFRKQYFEKLKNK